MPFAAIYVKLSSYHTKHKHRENKFTSDIQSIREIVVTAKPHKTKLDRSQKVRKRQDQQYSDPANPVQNLWPVTRNDNGIVELKRYTLTFSGILLVHSLISFTLQPYSLANFPLLITIMNLQAL